MILVIIIAITVVFLLIPLETNAELSSSEYKDEAYSLKSSYYVLSNEFSSAIKLSEKILSDLNLESDDAKNIIDHAWKVRWTAWSAHGEIVSELNKVEGNLNKKYYKTSYNQLSDIDKSLYTTKDELYAIVSDVKQARDAEKRYQENNQNCFLFWCDKINDTFSVLDTKILSLEYKLDNLELKLKKLETTKKSTTQSLYNTEITLKEQEIQKLTSKQKQDKIYAEMQQRLLQTQLKTEQNQFEQQRIQKEHEHRRLEQQKQREIENLERQRQQEQQQYQESLDTKERQRLQQLANDNPLIRQIISGQIKFYVHPIPYYAGNGVADGVNTMFDGLSSNSGFQRVYSESEADLHFQWIRDFAPDRIGQNYKNFNQIALGSTNCFGDWRPFDLITVWKITWHELGHSIGYPHNNDYNDIMYGEGTGNNFVSDYEQRIFLDEGFVKTIPFCGNGNFKYTLKSNNQYNGFKVYVVTPETNASDFIFKNIGKHYPSCGSNGNKIRAFSGECNNIPQGSKLLVYNPDELTQTSAINIQVEIFDMNERKNPDMVFNQSELIYSKELLDYVRKLF